MRNNIKVRFYPPVYKVIEDKGVVVCILKFKVLAPAIIKRWLPDSHCDAFYNVSPKVGVAKIKKGDTFDLHTGKKIALAKAEMKAYKYVAKATALVAQKVVPAMDMCYEMNQKANKVIAHNNEYIKKF